jgi:hypothetical protein
MPAKPVGIGFVVGRNNHKGTKDTKAGFTAEAAEKRREGRGQKNAALRAAFILRPPRFSASSAVIFLFVSFVSLWFV